MIANVVMHMHVRVELPKLVDSPVIDNVTCTQLDVTWLPWSPRHDVGTDTLHIASYT